MVTMVILGIVVIRMSIMPLTLTIGIIMNADTIMMNIEDGVDYF
jgi:hypothetical protein